jgi:hypothetical protein
MEKRVVARKTISAKRNGHYEIRKEHVTYSDGTTADVIACYSFAGKPLGGIQEAERLINAQVIPNITAKKAKK